MKREIEIPDYSREKGVGFKWNKSSKVACFIDGHEVLIKANEEGLESLAIALLSLAQKSVPSGSHIHLDDFADFLVKGSLVLYKEIEWDKKMEP